MHEHFPPGIPHQATIPLILFSHLFRIIIDPPYCTLLLLQPPPTLPSPRTFPFECVIEHVFRVCVRVGESVSVDGFVIERLCCGRWMVCSWPTCEMEVIMRCGREGHHRTRARHRAQADIHSSHSRPPPFTFDSVPFLYNENTKTFVRVYYPIYSRTKCVTCVRACVLELCACD